MGRPLWLLILKPRLMLRLIPTTMEDTVATMASVRLRLSPRPRLRLILTTMEDMAMEDMEDMVDMAVDTMAMDMAVNILHQDWNLDSFCPKLSQNSLFRINLI